MDPINFMLQHRQRLERRLGGLLDPRRFPEPRLLSAMRYSVLDGGKRLRPMLAWAAAEALGVDPRAADVPACALELIHVYSLIHDDLPAMDDDRLRRGKPTCHIHFDEATAILAGDALQSMAFGLLSYSKALAVSDRARLRMITELARASGAAGMVGGQSLDIRHEGRSMAHSELAAMQRLKTGALIRASVLLGALCRLLVSERELGLMAGYAECIGEAFQVRDDILDVISDTATLGKEQGRDVTLNKPTCVSVLGMSGAERRCSELIAEAIDNLADFGAAADTLRTLARYIASRTH